MDWSIWLDPQTFTGPPGGFLFAILVCILIRVDSNKRYANYRQDIAQLQATFNQAMDKVVEESRQERKFCEARYQAVLERLMNS